MNTDTATDCPRCGRHLTSSEARDHGICADCYKQQTKKEKQ